jgi:VWFA-related protein
MRTPLHILALAAAVLAQPPAPTVKFEVTSRLVVVNVSAVDRTGKPIEGLKAADFKVWEDDQPQTIAIFEFERLSTAPAKPIAPVLIPAPAAPAAPRPQVAPSAPGELRYKDRRLMALYFDMTAMGVAEQAKAKMAALAFLTKNMTEADTVAVMLFSSRLQVLQDFTADRARLFDVVRAIKVGEASELASDAPSETDDEVTEDSGAAYQADETEFNIFNTDRKLSALQTAVKMLSSMPEKKALVYFSAGIGKTGVENQSQLRATVNAAVRSNVAFYTIDTRGLMAFAPAGDATRGSPKGAGVYSGAMQNRLRASFLGQQETLYTLAADTGGKALLDSNDLVAGITQVQKDISSYYVLGYYSTNAAVDGRFRRIRVQLATDPRAKLDFRNGYYAQRDFRTASTADRELQLEEALMLGDPVTDLRLAVEVNYFRRGRGNYFVPVAVKIPGSQIELARKSGKDFADLDFVFQVKDKGGQVAGQVRDNIRVPLGKEQAGQLARRQLEYDSGVTLAPGEYTLRLVARENSTGKTGTFETRFRVPDVDAEKSYLRTSSVVIASQREPVAAALASGEAGRKAQAAHPLVAEGKKLIPSITRVFRQGQEMLVFLEVYGAATDTARQKTSLVANVTFFRDKVRVFSSDLARVERPAGLPAPVQFQVPLEKLAPGRYTCQVNVIDEQAERFAFDRFEVVVRP